MNDEAILAQMPIDRLTCFSDEKGEPSDKVKARQSKLLLKLWPVLSKYLKTDERILYVVLAGDGPLGVSPVCCVLVFTTIQIIRVPIMPTTTALVFTIERIYREPFEIDGGDRPVLHRITYGDIADFAIRGWINGSIALRYKDGRYEGYVIRDWGDHYKIGSFLKRYIARDIPFWEKIVRPPTEQHKGEK